MRTSVKLALLIVLLLLFTDGFAQLRPLGRDGSWGRADRAWGRGGDQAVDTWAAEMLASYITIHTTLPAGLEAELLSRLQPGGYLHTTFGPPGTNETVCDFVLGFKFDGDITTKGWTKSGTDPRWDFDGTVTTQEDLPGHSLGAGAGILTVSSDDDWAGLTVVNMSSNNFVGQVPNLTYAGLWSTITSFLIHANSFTGDLSGWDLTNWGSLNTIFIYNNGFDGDLSGWGFPGSLANFYIYNNGFTGDLSGWTLTTSFRYILIQDCSFTGDISSWTLPAGFILLYAYKDTFTVAGNFIVASLTDFRLDNNSLTETEVDLVLADFVSVSGGFDLSKSYSINLAGSNAAPSAATGEPHIDTLRGLAWTGVPIVITVTGGY